MTGHGVCQHDAISDAAENYGAAFRRWATEWARGDDENAERVCGGYVSVTGMLMPADCVLRASQAAIHALSGSTARIARGPTDNTEPPVRVLMVREMSVRPEPA